MLTHTYGRHSQKSFVRCGYPCFPSQRGMLSSGQRPVHASHPSEGPWRLASSCLSTGSKLGLIMNFCLFHYFERAKKPRFEDLWAHAFSKARCWTTVNIMCFKNLLMNIHKIQPLDIEYLLWVRHSIHTVSVDTEVTETESWPSGERRFMQSAVHSKDSAG